jgi:hypothetical protein
VPATPAPAFPRFDPANVRHEFPGELKMIDTIRNCAINAMMAFGIVGCVSIPIGDPATDTALKAFPANPDAAGI